MNVIQAAIERFVQGSAQPVLSEPGEELMEVRNGNLSLEERNGAVMLQAWDGRRNFVRRVTGIESESKARLNLRTQRFGKKAGTLAFVDLKRVDARTVGRQASRCEFRETFRRFLLREFPDSTIETLSTGQSLEQSLSSVYPRALIGRGSSWHAAIGAPPDAPVDGVLTFGLIWLDYLRRREPHRTVQGLMLFLPAGQEKTTCRRLRFLNPACASFRVFGYAEDETTVELDRADAGNLDTRLEPCQRSVAQADDSATRLASIGGVEAIHLGNGSTSFRVRGLEFARCGNGSPGNRDWLACFEEVRPVSAARLGELESVARELARVRSPDSLERRHPLFLRNPESWMESQVRSHIEDIDPGLRPNPVYGQVPAFAGGDRTVLDLLAVDRGGRLAIIELKASEDIHLPLQALDYWMRVKWHLDCREFSSNGYFPGVALSNQPPRLLLVAPALGFHPSNEVVLRFFSPEVPVERLGLGVEWQRHLRLMFRK